MSLTLYELLARNAERRAKETEQPPQQPISKQDKSPGPEIVDLPKYTEDPERLLRSDSPFAFTLHLESGQEFPAVRLLDRQETKQKRIKVDLPEADWNTLDAYVPTNRHGLLASLLHSCASLLRAAESFDPKMPHTLMTRLLSQEAGVVICPSLYLAELQLFICQLARLTKPSKFLVECVDILKGVR